MTPLIRHYPLTQGQQALWLDQWAWPDSPHLNVGGLGFLQGRIEPHLLEQALTQLIRDCDALRLVPISVAEQVVFSEPMQGLEVIDFGGAGDEQTVRRWFRHRMAEPFGLGQQPPWGCSLLRLSDERFALAFRCHHLVMDGWGVGLVMQVLGEYYSALQAGLPLPKPTWPSFVDAIADMASYVDSPAMQRDASYWQSSLNTRIGGRLPSRSERGLSGSPRQEKLPKAHIQRWRLPQAQCDALVALSSDTGGSVFAFFAMVIALYLEKTDGTEASVVLGVPTLNRSGKTFLETPGFFANLLPLCVPTLREMNRSEALAVIGQAAHRLLRHGRYPLSHVLPWLASAEGRGQAPFDVIVSFERQWQGVGFGAVKVEEIQQYFSGVARYPLAISICQFGQGQGIEVVLEMSDAYFTEAEAMLLPRRLATLLEAVLTNPSAKLGTLDGLPKEERWALLTGMHEGIAVRPDIHSFIEQFAHRARLHPAATALVWEEGQLDYRQLSAEVIQLARELRQQGVGEGRVVGVLLPRSPMSVVALLAVAWAGGAFLPLDPELPIHRHETCLRESGAVLLLTVQALLPPGVSLSCPLRFLGSVSASRDPMAFRTGALEDWPTPGSLAYVLFTSGSTGQPKGVEVTHEALARRLAWMARAFEIRVDDRSLQQAPSGFDPSLIELCLPLAAGASVALMPPGRHPPNQLALWVKRFDASFLALVPSTLQGLLNGWAAVFASQPSRLRVACCGGEVLAPALSNRFLQETGARLFNVYGPTEAVIFATAWPCQESPREGGLPLGKPIDDTRVYVLDGHQQLMPIGVPGEICLGGAALARGYVGEASLPQGASHFMSDPFMPDGCLYRTGDRGFVGADGHLYFLGRLDRQVKLRGWRVEPGEVEASLLQQGGVLQAAVKAVELSGTQQLVGWIAVADTVLPAVAQGAAERVLAALRQRLPDYMLPAKLICQPTLPVLSSGKVDYSQLTVDAALPSAPLYEPPRNPMERLLVSTWESVLNRRPIGIHHSFFESGGDSLSALDMLASVERRVGRKLPLFLLAEHPTIARLAEAIGDFTPEQGVLLPLSGGSDRPSLLLAASGYGDLWRFKALADCLGGEVALTMLQPARHLSDSATLETLVHDYAREIIDQGNLPGWLAGFSVGGVVAFETAVLLKQRGFDVKGVILIDTVYPGKWVYHPRVWAVLNRLMRWLCLGQFSFNGWRLEAMFADHGLQKQVRYMHTAQISEPSFPVWLVRSQTLHFFLPGLFSSWKKRLGLWGRYLTLPGNHGSLFSPRRIGRLAELIQQVLGRKS